MKSNVQTSSEAPGKYYCTETNMFDRYSCILYDSMKNPVEDTWKIMKKSLWLHCTHPLTPFCFSLFVTSFCAKCIDVDVNKNQDKMLIPGQPWIVVWRYVPSWGFLSKNHAQTARESHDTNMVLVVLKWLLVDLTMALNSCVHRYLCKNTGIICKILCLFRCKIIKQI